MCFLYDCYLMANATESEWFGHQGQKYGNVVPCRVFSLLFPALIQISYYNGNEARQSHSSMVKCQLKIRDPCMPLTSHEVSEHVHGGHDKLEVLAIDHGVYRKMRVRKEWDEIEREDEEGGGGGGGGQAEMGEDYHPNVGICLKYTLEEESFSLRHRSGCIRLAVVKPASPNQILLIAESNSMLPYLTSKFHLHDVRTQNKTLKL
ncbi:hypothetical protein Prudu_021441 [Prunus dulcis]|uniref:Uncharacterized protein n=1 Tax=Prunus dulcis TaxID=3755 RepID=A0A4Y1RYI3_PRUDU|nr:hypothetical protein Prudu_021441 [Prunus dulcis]